jgi:methyl-accepting chemotaxis protein
MKRWFVNLEIKYKIFVVFSALTAVSVATGVVGYSALDDVGENDDVLVRKTTQPLPAMAYVQNLFQGIRVNCRSLLLAETPEERELFAGRIRSYIAETDAVAAKFERTVEFEEEREAYEEWQASRKASYRELEQFIALANEGRDREAFLYLNEEMAASAKRENDALATLMDLKVKYALETAEANKKTIGVAKTLAWALAALGAALAVGLGYLLARGLARPIVRVAEVAERVGEGDFEARAPVASADEIGDLARAFNQMADAVEDSRAKLEEEKRSVELRVEEAVRESERLRDELIRDVETILEAMNSFSDGDLSATVAVEREGPIGKLFEGFNRAVERIDEMIGHVTDAIAVTADNSREISAGAKDVADGAVRQTAQTGEIAGAVQEMTMTAEETKNNADVAAETAGRAGDEARAGGEAVQEVVEGMRKIVAVVNRSAETISKLGENSNKIGDIVGVIEEIADQTNLLALNAAIEAARAGEQGRGFAVVADEVRKLAERTSKATKEISSMINQIQADTIFAVAEINNGAEAAQKGEKTTARAGDAIKRIVDSSGEVVQRIQHLANSSEQQLSAALDISRSIEEISGVTNRTSEGMQAIARASDELRQLTDALSGTVSQFKNRR